MFTSLTAMRVASRRATNYTSRADNMKSHQNKAMHIWAELLDEGNLIDRPSLSIDNCHLGSKGSLDGIEVEREPTNLVPRVRAWVASGIPIMEGLMDFLVARGRRPLWFRKARVWRASGIGEPPDL